jgi:hypothetical protein
MCVSPRVFSDVLGLDGAHLIGVDLCSAGNPNATTIKHPSAIGNADIELLARWSARPVAFVVIRYCAQHEPMPIGRNNKS